MCVFFVVVVVVLLFCCFFPDESKTLKESFSKILCLEAVEISSLSLHSHHLLIGDHSLTVALVSGDPLSKWAWRQSSAWSLLLRLLYQENAWQSSLWILQEQIKHTPNSTVSSASAQVPPCSFQSLVIGLGFRSLKVNYPAGFRRVQLACNLNI